MSIVTDAYSRRIVGFNLHPTLASEGAVNALFRAVSKRKKTLPLIHHSDRGTQYCCTEYVQLLEYFKIQISMRRERRSLREYYRRKGKRNIKRGVWPRKFIHIDRTGTSSNK